MDRHETDDSMMHSIGRKGELISTERSKWPITRAKFQIHGNQRVTIRAQKQHWAML